MGQRRKFSGEYNHEAVAMLESPGVTVNQIAAELGIGATVLGRWRRELRLESAQVFRGNGRPRDEDRALLRRVGPMPSPPPLAAANVASMKLSRSSSAPSSRNVLASWVRISRSTSRSHHC